jgi:predicted dithiol-disulfide oxidoreductase (DUF899 family)
VTEHRVVDHEEWLEARKALLAEEKSFTRARDQLTRRRQELPWERVDTEYVFDGELGPKTLEDLFAGRSQLVVYHFMFGRDDDAGCKHCSFWADNFDPIVVHLAARDTTMVAISRAPLEKLLAYRQRMGWSFPWLSSAGNSFNRDFGVSFEPEQFDQPVYNYGLSPGLADREGVSVFFLADDAIFHTYSAYARGIDLLNTAYNYIDLTPKGRDEAGRAPQYWVQRHDEYETAVST